MSGQRARPSATADLRSVHPNIAGIPWWGAILTAVIASAIGFAFDAGSGGGQLSAVFSALYVIGCLIAVLAVQQSAIFTAVIQPPLVLFVTVPSAYFLMHNSDIHGIKDILINCGYPLIERFPLMFFTSATVLLIGLARWYFGKASPPSAAEKHDGPGSAVGGPGLLAKLSSLLRTGSAAGTTEKEPGKRRAADRRRTEAPKPTAGGPARGGRPAKRATPRSRNPRAAETEIIEPVTDRPRRRRPRPDEQPATAEPRRRPRRSSSREPREPLPRERREPRARYDRDERYEPPRPQRERPQRRSRFDDYEPFDPYGSNGDGTHHPISRVRYRGGDPDDRPEPRPRGRVQRDVDADRWEYDI